MTAQEKFQNLLRELFQFDLADLDFGIYRILNYKRRVIEKWLNEDLPKAIREELQKGTLAEQAEAQRALEETRQKVLETLGEDAIDAEGNLAERYRNTRVGREYLEARAKAAHAEPAEALEAAVYNHLYTFFSRYWQDGDFISKRRYSKKERYAIPYNGEEVYLYWANHDQYYVKTAEYFTDYTWKAPGGVTVHFKLQAADVEVNNVKGEKRFFIPVLDGIAWDAEARTLTVPFHYRPLSEQEKKTYGDRNQQDKIIEEALQSIPSKLRGNSDALAALTAERRRDAQGNPVSWLEHHLRQYTARNTRDFFIHKDLRGFLSRELDFYLKNEVLNLDELEAAGEDLAEGWFQLMRLIKRIGNHIIDFLAQIEDFQKALWEKKKFVTETFWCITVGNIAEDLYREIAQNKAQWQEWRELFHIHELPENLWSGNLKTIKGRVEFLKAHPTLPLDTRHFPQDFTDRLLASFDNLDEMTDGLLVHSENWQALNLLREKYRERVECIYIDPPYNTGDSEILYKNEYLRSSWLSLMENRLTKSMQLLGDDFVIFIAIDDFEMVDLCELIDKHFGSLRREMIVVNHHPQGGKAKTLAATHEYMLACVPVGSDRTLRGRIISETVEYRPFKRSGTAESNFRRARPNSFYAILVDPRTKEVVGAEPPPAIGSQYPTGPTEEGYIRVYPVGAKGEERVWRRSYESGLSLISAKKLVCSENLTIYQLIEAHERTPALFSNWIDPRYNAGTFGANYLADIIGRHNPFPYPKSIHTVEDAIFSSGLENDAVVLDYFAGSGTTAHAVINLNREDGGRRKFILVEMADYFDTVLLPRIKKVIFTPEWKDGKPERIATQEEFERGPRVIKVIRLESYEDALNNITFDEESGWRALALFGDEYLLHYMLRWESKKSETFLDVEKLQTPFCYKLRIHRDGETREQPVDLPETFAYLIGLDVEKREVHYDGDRRYLVHRGTTRDGRRVAVIWRETKDWSEKNYRRDAAFVAEQKMTEGADEIFVNSDSFIPGARSLDGIFKARLFGEEG